VSLHGQLRLRLMLGQDIALGPGKADLLEAIQRHGSISAAAKSLDMSYRRAWLLVETMNACFAQPLVSPVKGGRGGGGAELTAAGLRMLAAYRRLQREAERLVDAHLAEFEPHLRRRGRTR